MSTIITRASFVIFKDEPSSPVKTKASTANTTSSTRTTAVLAIVTAKDKENLHPITGRRPSTEDAVAKKRKGGGVLATKLLKASGKTVCGSSPSQRKRKLSVSSDKNHHNNEKADAKKKKPTSIATRRPKVKSVNRVRKITELPKVEEEEPVVEEEHTKESCLVGSNNTQAAVDSKCYELTVIPLADVSKAFESSSSPEDESVKHDAEPRLLPIKDDAESPSPQGEPDIRTSSEDPATKTPTQRKLGPLSTPERKRLYAAFTFASPSPTSKRYVSSRASSMDHFSDLNFDPITDALTFCNH